MIRARRVLEELWKNNVTHVIGLPDNTSMELFRLLQGTPGIRLVPVTREGEAFAIAAGLWIGGRIPVVMIQNTGLLESGDSIRGTVMRMRAPLVSLITYRGYHKMKPPGEYDAHGAPDANALSCARRDSAALVTEPTLRAWGVPYDFLHEEADVIRISDAFRNADRDCRPQAILITQDLVPHLESGPGIDHADQG